MDRRQRKSREAIFTAFTELLSKKEYTHITVGEIIERADVGRATFYAHFETKEYLLKELCKELFCHIFDAAGNTPSEHRHIFECDTSDAVFLHLFKHLQKNDHNILVLFSCRNNELFMQYFEEELKKLIVSRLSLFEARRNAELPDSFWVDHIVSVFTQTVRWWVKNGTEESPEVIAEYFYAAV